MSDSFVAEIRMFAGNFPPAGWALCNGQLLPISQNTTLFSLLGTTYGGDGYATFGLPDLRGRAPLHAGEGAGLSPRDLGESGGSAKASLSADHMPFHAHQQQASSALASVSGANGSVLARTVSPNPPYHLPDHMQPLGPAALAYTGGGQQHNNLQPYLEVSFIISLQGTYPPRA